MKYKTDYISTQESQEPRKKKSITPWLVGGGLVAAGGLGLGYLKSVEKGVYKKIADEAVEKTKQRGTNYMKYTTTAEFGLAGTMNTGVLNKMTGQLGSTVNKAKSWLQNAQKTKQEIGSAIIAKKRLLPQQSLNAKAEAMAFKKYGSAGVENAPALQSTLGKKTKSLGDSLNLQSKAALRTDLTAGSARQVNRGSSDRFSKSGTKASVADNRSLRLKYTKDPRTGKLVSAAYNTSISFLCDI